LTETSLKVLILKNRVRKVDDLGAMVPVYRLMKWSI